MLTFFIFILLFGICYVKIIERLFHTKFTDFSIPMYFSLGLIFVIDLYYALAFLYLSKTVILLSLALCFTFLGIVFFKDKKDKSISLYNRKSVLLNHLITLFLSLLSLIIFTRIAYIMQIFTGLDPLTHGMYVSLILYHKKFPNSLKPILKFNFNIWRYPMGFHILSALVSILHNTPPARSMLITASVITMMIPLLFYEITYRITKRIRWGLLSFFVPFILPIYFEPPGWRYFDILISPYQLGAYPNILGNFIFLSIIALLIYAKDKDLYVKIAQQA